MIRIEHLSKSLGKKRVLKDITLSLENQNYGLIGPNGSGKTTLMRTLCGIYEPDPGTVGIDSRTWRIGYLPQVFGAFLDLSAEEQLRYYAYLKERPHDGISWKDEVDRVLSLTHLEEQRHTRCRALSGGMIRRLGIAQALMGEPDFVLLDEPTTGLDIAERAHFREILTHIQGERPIVIATHILEDVRDSCREWIVLKEGTVIYAGSPEELVDDRNKGDLTLDEIYLELLQK